MRFESYLSQVTTRARSIKGSLWPVFPRSYDSGPGLRCSDAPEDVSRLYIQPYTSTRIRRALAMYPASACAIGGTAPCTRSCTRCTGLQAVCDSEEINH